MLAQFLKNLLSDSVYRFDQIVVFFIASPANKNKTVDIGNMKIGIPNDIEVGFRF